jgi:hypothetical protein
LSCHLIGETCLSCRLIGETCLSCRLLGETCLSCRLLGETCLSSALRAAGDSWLDVIGNRSGHAAFIHNDSITVGDGLVIRVNMAALPSRTTNTKALTILIRRGIGHAFKEFSEAAQIVIAHCSDDFG